MGKVIKKLKASTLLEPVIASVVLTIAVSTFSMSLGNVVKMGNASQQLNIKSLLNEISNKSINEGKWLDESFEYENFFIHKTVDKYNEQENLYVLTLKAIDNENEVIEENRQLIRVIEK